LIGLGFFKNFLQQQFM